MLHEYKGNLNWIVEVFYTCLLNDDFTQTNVRNGILSRRESLHHFRHRTKHRSRHFNHAKYTNPFPVYFHFRYSKYFHFRFLQTNANPCTHILLLYYTVIDRYWPTHVETPIFHSVIWYLAYTYSDRFQTFTIWKICFLQGDLSINSVWFG